MLSLVPESKCFPDFRHRSALLTSRIEVLSLFLASKCFPFFRHRSAFLSSGIEVLSLLPASKCAPYFPHRGAFLTSDIEVFLLYPGWRYLLLVGSPVSYASIFQRHRFPSFKALPKLGFSCLASLRALRTAFTINPFPGNILERCFKRISYLGLSWFASTRLSYSFLYFLHNLPNSFFSSTLYFPKLPRSNFFLILYLPALFCIFLYFN